MPNTVPSSQRGFNSSFRGALSPRAFYEVFGTDFGATAPAAPTLAYNAGAGSLAASTASSKVTWITKNGESLPSAEATDTIAAGSGAFTITQPTVPTNGTAVIGWRVYSGNGTGNEALNAASNSTTQAQQNFTVSNGSGGTTTITGFPIATTAVQVLIYGAGAAAPLVDRSGIQTALPSVAANSSDDYVLVVPNQGSQWRQQSAVDYIRPDGTAETSGISIGGVDVVNPLYPGTSTNVTAGTGVSSYCVLNGYLYQCTTSGETASAFIGSGAFNQARGATTTDGTVVWISLGKASIIRIRFLNSSGSAAVPAAQEYDLFAF